MRDCDSNAKRAGRGKHLCRLLAAGALACVAPTAASAASVVVDSLGDAVDGGDGVTTLREAIIAANGSAGLDDISFSVTGTITLTSALPSVTDSLVIQGPGAASLTIDGAGTYDGFFVSDNNAAMTFELSDLTIANTEARGGNGGTSAEGGGGGGLGAGAGVFIDRGVTATITSVDFVGCSVFGGVGGSQTGATSGGGGGGLNGTGGLSGAPLPTGGGAGGNGPVPYNGSGGSPSGNNGNYGGGGAGGNASATSDGDDGGNGGFGGGGGGGGASGGFSSNDGNGGFGGFGAGGGGGSPNGGGGTFGGNGAGDGGGGAGLGGAVFVSELASAELVLCSFTGCAANGGPGGNQGLGHGGGIFVQDGASVFAGGLSFSANSAQSAFGTGYTPGLEVVTNDVWGTINALAAPQIVSFTSLESNPTNDATLTWEVVFDSPVTGVTTDDFVLVAGPSGISPTAVSVSGSGTTWQADFSADVPAEGSLLVRLVDDDSIINVSATPLGGFGVDASTDSALLTVDRLGPVLQAPLARATGQAGLTDTLPVLFEVSFTLGLDSFDATSVDLSNSTAPGTLVATVNPLKSAKNEKGLTTSAFEISVSGASGAGDIVVDLVPANITDAIGNPLIGSGTATVTYDPFAKAGDWRALDN